MHCSLEYMKETGRCDIVKEQCWSIFEHLSWKISRSDMKNQGTAVVLSGAVLTTRGPDCCALPVFAYPLCLNLLPAKWFVFCHLHCETERLPFTYYPRKWETIRNNNVNHRRAIFCSEQLLPACSDGKINSNVSSANQNVFLQIWLSFNVQAMHKWLLVFLLKNIISVGDETMTRCKYLFLLFSIR